MSEKGPEFEAYQPEIRYAKTPEGHKITFEPDNKDVAPVALAMAAFEKSKVSKGGFMTGYSEYKSDITAARARELIKETSDSRTGQLFFLDYVHGKKVDVGARQNNDGSITLIDRTGNPIPDDKAKLITETADDTLWEVGEPEE